MSVFKVGDKVVYPMHGAGVIESIERKEILGSMEEYYVMKMPLGDMKVMIPTKKAEDIGVRSVVNTSETERVYEKLSSPIPNVSSNWNKRYRENLEKIKTGNIFEVAEVVRTLAQRDREKGLSTGERKMFNSAKQILISELVLANGNINQRDVEKRICSVVMEGENNGSVESKGIES